MENEDKNKKAEAPAKVVEPVKSESVKVEKKKEFKKEVKKETPAPVAKSKVEKIEPVKVVVEPKKVQTRKPKYKSRIGIHSGK